MKILGNLFLFLCVPTAFAGTPCANSPKEAYATLKEAYENKDIAESINAIDFREWAKINNEHFGVVIEASELKEEFKTQLAKAGFPDYANLSCNITETQHQGLVVVEEKCNFINGGSYKQSLVAVKASCGWKLAGPYLPKKVDNETRGLVNQTVIRK